MVNPDIVRPFQQRPLFRVCTVFRGSKDIGLGAFSIGRVDDPLLGPQLSPPGAAPFKVHPVSRGEVCPIYPLQGGPGGLGGQAVVIVVSLVGHIIGRSRTGKPVRVGENRPFCILCPGKDCFILLGWLPHIHGIGIILQDFRIVQPHDSGNGSFPGQGLVQMEVPGLIAVQKMYLVVHIHPPLHPEYPGHGHISHRIRSPIGEKQGNFPFHITIGVVPGELGKHLLVVYVIFNAAAIVPGIVYIVAQCLGSKQQENHTVVPIHPPAGECIGEHMGVPHRQGIFPTQGNEGLHQLIEAFEVRLGKHILLPSFGNKPQLQGDSHLRHIRLLRRRLLPQPIPGDPLHLPAVGFQEVTFLQGVGVVVRVQGDVGVEHPVQRHPVRTGAVAQDAFVLPAAFHQVIPFLYVHSIQVVVVAGVIHPVNGLPRFRGVPGDSLVNPAVFRQEIPLRRVGGIVVLAVAGVINPVDLLSPGGCRRISGSQYRNRHAQYQGQHQHQGKQPALSFCHNQHPFGKLD